MQSNPNYRSQNNIATYPQNQLYPYENMNIHNQQSYPTGQNVPYSTNLQSHPNSSMQNYTTYQASSAMNEPNSFNMGINQNNIPPNSVGVPNAYGRPVPIHSASPPSTASTYTSHSGKSTTYPFSQDLAVAPLEPLKPLKGNLPFREGF